MQKNQFLVMSHNQTTLEKQFFEIYSTEIVYELEKN